MRWKRLNLTLPTPTPQVGTACNRLHWEAVPEKGIASFWKGDTLLKIGRTLHGWHANILDDYKNDFYTRTIVQWNNLPPEIIASPSPCSFQSL